MAEKAQITEEKCQQAEREAQAKLRAAQIEDRLREEDMDREKNGNHPQRSHLAAFKPPTAPKSKKKPSESHSGSASSQPASNPQAEEPLQSDQENPSVPDLQARAISIPATQENPSVPILRARATSTIPATRVSHMNQQLDSDDGSEGDEYIPPPAPEEEDDGEEELESDDIVEEEPAKRGKCCKATRDDVSALRVTDVASGKHAASHVSEPPTKKTKTSKKTSTFRKGWESHSAHQRAQTGHKQPGAKSEPQTDSMVSYGGFISDDDHEEGQMEEDGAKSSGVEARGQSLIKITGHKTFTPRTQKELCGGRAK
ncbi:hypothetical protein H0H92_009896, partial [Tricholoma furcatifolium]